MAQKPPDSDFRSRLTLEQCRANRQRGTGQAFTVERDRNTRTASYPWSGS